MQGAEEMQDAEEIKEAEEMPEHWKEIYRETYEWQLESHGSPNDQKRIPELAIRVFNAVISLANTPKTNSSAIGKALLEVTNDIETAVCEMKKRADEEASRSNFPMGKKKVLARSNPRKKRELSQNGQLTKELTDGLERCLRPQVNHAYGTSTEKLRQDEGSH
ncbi:hypothetical protein CDL15_Pgr023939 [Punica granatum]|uniref:Uncharacterized protein n=1 Tax=Punica granatum TaxID=22663 RepID=A0A218XVU9_PUNGR|nr:hypothetical protein CDL15_Pgr023939 [Punica granatum]